MESTPRLSSISGASRVLIAAMGVDDAVTILVSQFGWDMAFSAMAGLDGPDGCAGLWRALQALPGDQGGQPGA